MSERHNRLVAAWVRAVMLSLLAVAAAGCAGHKMPAPVAVETAASAAPPSIAGPEEGFRLAMESYKKGDLQTALLLARQVGEQYPNTPWARRSLFLTGKTFIALDRAAEAEEAMLRVPVEYPELSDYAFYLLGEYYFSKTRYLDAAAFYQRLMDRHPKSFWVIRSSLRRSQALLEAGSYSAAAESFDKFLKDYPRSEYGLEAGLGFGRALTGDGKLDRAARAYRDVCIRYPGTASDQDVDKALGELKLLGADIPEPTMEERYERARNLFKTSQYDKAAAAFSSLLEDEPRLPQKPDVLLRMGVSLLYLGRRSEAIQTLERMVKEHPAEQRGAEALNWLGRAYNRIGDRDRAVSSFLKIVSAYPGSEWADDALYLIGNIYREANDTRNALKFYDRLATNFPDSSFADSAIWWKAWAYYTAGDYKKTEQTLSALIAKYPRSFLVNQALYWQGRSVEKTGNKTKAAAYYRNVVTRAPYTYYGYRASERLATTEVPSAAKADITINEMPDAALLDTAIPEEPFDADGPPVWTDAAVEALSANPSFKKSLELMQLDMKKEAAAELWSIQEKTPRKHGALLGLSKTFFELGDYYRSLIIILRNYERYLEGPARDKPEDLWLLAYPQGYWESILTYSKKYGLDPYFVTAIIREESQFHAEALSPAGARGVMQVMPSTGEWVAQAIKMRGFDRSKLFEYDTSVSIGAWYISYLMKRFKGDPILVAASYNAGPEAVSGWLGKNGNGAVRDEFVENIPFSETRGYVKKVLRNYAEYKRIYGRAGVTSMPAPPRNGGDAVQAVPEEQPKTP